MAIRGVLLWIGVAGAVYIILGRLVCVTRPEELLIF